MGHVNTQYETEFEESIPLVDGIKTELDFFEEMVWPSLNRKGISKGDALIYFKLSKMDQALLDIVEEINMLEVDKDD